MIAFAHRLEQAGTEEREQPTRRYRWDAKPFRNPEAPPGGLPLGAIRKCNTPGCPVHIYPAEYCGDCRQPTIELREWRRAVDAGEIVR